MHIQIFDCYVFLMNLLFNRYKMSMFIFNIFFALRFTLSVINIALPVFLYLLFVFYIFLSIYFQSMYVKCVSYRLNIVGSCILKINSYNFCILLGSLVH